jgi:hypothetical protein
LASEKRVAGQGHVHVAPFADGIALQRSDIAGPAPQLNIESTVSGQERVELEALVAATLAVLNSNRFATNMAALAGVYPRVWLSKALRFSDSNGLYERLQSPPSPNTYVITEVFLDGDRSDTRVWVDPEPNTARLRVGRGQLEMYRSTNIVERSCPINSLAHEISHTLSTSSERFLFAITDTGRGRRGAGKAPYASFLIGSVAQCTYLQQQERIGEAGLGPCVEAFRVRPPFYVGRCRAFEPDESVKWPKDPKPEV